MSSYFSTAMEKWRSCSDSPVLNLHHCCSQGNLPTRAGSHRGFGASPCLCPTMGTVGTTPLELQLLLMHTFNYTNSKCRDLNWMQIVAWRKHKKE